MRSRRRKVVYEDGSVQNDLTFGPGRRRNVAQGQCRQCAREFSYRWRHKERFVCDRCKAKNHERAKRRVDLRRATTLADDGRRVLRADGQWGQRMTLEQVAKLMGLSMPAVRRIEVSALEKLRRNPKARQILLDLRDYGLEGAKAMLTPSDLSELVDYQMAVGEWWRVADALADGGAPEAGEVKTEIEAFQELLSRTIAELTLNQE